MKQNREFRVELPAQSASATYIHTCKAGCLSSSSKALAEAWTVLWRQQKKKKSFWQTVFLRYFLWKEPLRLWSSAGKKVLSRLFLKHLQGNHIKSMSECWGPTISYREIAGVVGANQRERTRCAFKRTDWKDSKGETDFLVTFENPISELVPGGLKEMRQSIGLPFKVHAKGKSGRARTIVIASELARAHVF